MMAITGTNPPERGRIFQERATRFFSGVLSVPLSERTVPLDLGGLTYKADMVDEGITFVGEVKDYRWRENGGFPSGKLQGTESALTKLGLVTKKNPVRRVLVLNDHINPSNSRSLVDSFLSSIQARHAKMLEGIEVWKYTQGATLRDDIAIQVSGPDKGLRIHFPG